MRKALFSVRQEVWVNVIPAEWITKEIILYRQFLESSSLLAKAQIFPLYDRQIKE